MWQCCRYIFLNIEVVYDLLRWYIRRCYWITTKIQIYKKNWQEIFGLGSLLLGRKYFIKAWSARPFKF
jgi:hypothetical protein